MGMGSWKGEGRAGGREGGVGGGVSFRRFRRLTGDLIASAREVLTRTRFIRAMTIKLDPAMVREMRLAWADGSLNHMKLARRCELT